MCWKTERDSGHLRILADHCWLVFLFLCFDTRSLAFAFVFWIIPSSVGWHYSWAVGTWVCTLLFIIPGRHSCIFVSVLSYDCLETMFILRRGR
ncbi:hypothetical protein CONLIGDRAFT_120508 [Coniochaeta ligniaria NRRL 30616]|uniref:Uncharacterized protein n=1 Tax=Coniochaeta ligniaria NRRL 30616 TaxID=1408157 RepID=A0A1J7ISA7_9PEZI|nr:hypothetical protein CONLIGDRAFT_120508 [Coniochaeta ligniaria NRRL 30616]